MELIDHEKLLIKIARILEGLDIKYFVTGGFAVSIWGRPRATFDIDIIIKIIEPQAVPLAKALQTVSKAGYADENMIKDAIRYNGEFNFIDPTTGLKIDFWVTKEKDNYPPEFKNRKLEKIGNQKVYFSSPEDLILSKLQWHEQNESTRHLEDVESILRVSAKKLDWNYLKQWAEKLGVLEVLNKLIKKRNL